MTSNEAVIHYRLRSHIFLLFDYRVPDHIPHGTLVPLSYHNNILSGYLLVSTVHLQRKLLAIDGLSSYSHYSQHSGAIKAIDICILTHLTT